MHRLSAALFGASALSFLLGFFGSGFALAIASGCAPNTPGLCITSQTPNPSSPGQPVTISGTAPTPPTGSVWTLYCRFDNNPKIPWDGCGANTSPTGAWTISVSFSTIGTHTVDIALNNQGIAGSYVTATQNVQGTIVTTTATTTATTTQTLLLTTTYTTTISGSVTTVINTMTITSFSTVTYNPSISTTTYTTIFTSSGQTVTSTVTTTASSSSIPSSLSTIFFIGGGFLGGLAFTVYIQERKHGEGG